ncbi:MAG: hypothetical protein NZO16_08135, partial [Deltaproteobacteria bacterium]|nr:hypothetical protein [Deltaproteobacteria bacterium]
RTLNVLSQLVTNYLDWSHEREIQVPESFAALWFSSLYLSVNEFNDPYTFEDLTAPIPMLSEGFRNNLLSQIDHTQLLNLVIQAEEEAKNNTVLRERIQKFRKFLEDHYSKQDFN